MLPEQHEARTGVRRPAAFLDRDGTIIVERHYLADPDGVALLPGAAEALRALADHGFALVLVTNQSGIGRGLYTEAGFRAVQARLTALLEEQDVAFDGVFHCPHHPDYDGPCDCRKPGLALFHAAADSLGLDMAASIFIGDRLRDVLPARAFGARGFLVRTGHGAAETGPLPDGIRDTADLGEAARIAIAAG
jgi:D-glycero-D-manno-heptose 1,7-bisphosphate phosphatase